MTYVIESSVQGGVPLEVIGEEITVTLSEQVLRGDWVQDKSVGSVVTGLWGTTTYSFFDKYGDYLLVPTTNASYNMGFHLVKDGKIVNTWYSGYTLPVLIAKCIGIYVINDKILFTCLNYVPKPYGGIDYAFGE